MITANENQSWLAAHAGLELAGANVAWLNAKRAAALALFDETGLPGIRDEDWRYTNLRALKNNAYAPSTPTSLTLEIGETENPRLVFVDCLLYTSPSPRDQRGSRMPSSA